MSGIVRTHGIEDILRGEQWAAGTVMGGLFGTRSFGNILRGERIFDRRRSRGFGCLRLSGSYRCDRLGVLEQLGKRVRL